MTDTDAADPFAYEGVGEYFKALLDWFYPVIQDEWDKAVVPVGPYPWRLHMGVLVFGDYVGRFLDLCVPSLLAPGNLGSLPRSTIVIHTDAASLPKLASGIERLEAVAEVEISVIPEAIMSKVFDHPTNKYWLLTTTHYLDMQTAKYRLCGFHMLMADHVYAANYFAGIQRLSETYEAIVQGNLSASLEAVAPLLSEPMASRDLNALALNNLHPQVLPFVMNGREGYPGVPVMTWVGPDRVETLSPHMSIVYLSHAVVLKAPVRLFSTIDAQLPFLIPGDAYVPTPDDDMAYMEVSDSRKAPSPFETSTLQEVCVRFWLASYCHFEHIRYIEKSTVLGLPPGYVPPFEPMALDDIHEALRVVREAVRISHADVKRLAPADRQSDPLLRAA